ncbi:MAG: glycosyltransferase [Lachnospiraceae bacterium]|nr:glycosyltransferase [Lachnospiraceae bacterium]
MKILIFAEVYYPDVMGGGEFSTKQMTEGLAKKGHEVIVYCLGNKTQEDEIEGVHIKRNYINGVSEHFLSLCKNNRSVATFTPLEKIIRKRSDLYLDKKCYEVYRRIISKEKPNIVHTVSPMSYLGRINLWKAAYDLRIPISHVCRGPNLLEMNFLGGRLDAYNRSRNAKASEYLTALAAPSRYMLASHNRAGIRGQRFNEVIYNAVNMKPITLTKEFIGEKENMVLYAGEISEKKGINTLIEAVDGLEGVRLLLIGNGEMVDAIKRNGKTAVADWMDREALYGYMRKAKAVILPSKWNEPFGRILIEAIYNGTIAIGSDRGGIPEVLDFDGDYIFHDGDKDGLRGRIERVMGMSTSAYMDEALKQQKMAERFSDDIYIENWERFFLNQIC